MIRHAAPLAAVLTASVLAAPASAHEVKAGALTLSELHMRASLGANPNTAAYLTIANAGDRPDRLTSASCACAAKVMIHATTVRGGMASMTHLANGVAIPARGRAVLAPGGMHIMLTGLKTPLADGATQELTLRFEHAGVVKARFHVTNRIPSAVHTGH